MFVKSLIYYCYIDVHAFEIYQFDEKISDKERY